MEERIAADIPIATALLAEINSDLKEVENRVKSWIEKLKNGDYNTSKGISLLEFKNQAFLSYIMDLSLVFARKLDGLSLDNEPCIERLVELRVSIERLRPMEDKLKYQIEKCCKIVKEGVPKDDDPSRLGGDIANVDMSSDDEEEEEGGNKTSKKKDDEQDNTYKIPKISKMPYPGEEEEGDKKKEHARKRALTSSMLRDALHEYTDDPTVIHNTDVLKEKAIRKRKEIEKYEEENMTRINLTKKQRTEMRHMNTLGNMKGELLSFHSLDALDPEAAGEKQQKPRGGKSKTKGKGKNKKGFKKRR